jgi:hypothetical protein
MTMMTVTLGDDDDADALQAIIGLVWHELKHHYQHHLKFIHPFDLRAHDVAAALLNMHFCLLLRQR